MYKSDIVKSVSKKTMLSQSIISEVLNSTLSEIQNNLRSGEKVIFPGFGKFYISKRQKGMAINFKTKVKVEVPEVTIARFSPGRLLKKDVKKQLVTRTKVKYKGK